MTIDNFLAHRSKTAVAPAEDLDIHLVFLLPYCPHLNPIEFVWKSLKRVVSKTRIISREHMTGLLSDAFSEETAKDSYYGLWTKLFHKELVSLFR